MKPQTAVYDACVLYPAPLRDTLVTLACAGLVRARWTYKIHEEWISNLLENRPDLTRAMLERTRDKMIEAIPDSLVAISAILSDELELPDFDDRHVLAAAIQAEAQVIVTANSKDFPNTILNRYDIEKRSPDSFIAELVSAEPLAVLRALRSQRERLRNPPQSVDIFLSTLRRQGLETSVGMIDPYKDLLE